MNCDYLLTTHGINFGIISLIHIAVISCVTQQSIVAKNKALYRIIYRGHLWSRLRTDGDPGTKI